MPAAPETISARDARRALLAAQRLCGDPFAPCSHRTLLGLIEDLGYVQLDSINVLERAHHLTLFARHHHYRREQLADLQERDRALFEHWTHDASLIPVTFFANWSHRRKRLLDRKQNRLHAWMRQRLGRRPKHVLDGVLRRIEREGPLQSRDFEHAPGTSTPWWGWKPAKAALEYLWWRGELSIAARVNFQKVYDLTERIFPHHHALPPPAEHEFIDWCCREALRRSGPATVREIADFFGALSQDEVRRWRDEALPRGEIVPLLIEAVDGSKPVAGMALPEWRRDAARWEVMNHGPSRLLSPFDPVVRNRDRTRRLFNFDYSFEAFVPAPKREFGYYVLPILQGELIIGRTDLKLDRARKTLVVNGLWLEQKVRPSRKLRADIDESLERLADFLGATSTTRPPSR